MPPTASNLGDEAVSVSSGTASTSQANTLAAATSGVVTATLSDGDLATLAGLTETGNAYSITITDTTVDAAASQHPRWQNHRRHRRLQHHHPLTGAAADLNTAYAANGSSISGLGNEDVTLSDTTLAVSVLNTLDGNTSGTIDASNITTLTGVADDLITAYAANGSGISGLGNEAVNVSSGTATTYQANTLAAATSGVVTATLSDGDLATLAGLSETGNAYSITITDTSVDAAALNTLDGKTTVAINASNITTLTGAAADLNTAYTANDNGSISGLSNEDVTLSDTTLDVSTLNTLDGNTSGTIDASNVTTLTGAAADLNTAYDRQRHQQSRPEHEAVTLSDTTLDVSVLNTLDGNTSGTIDASTITTLTGAAADLNTAYDSNGSASAISAMRPSLSPTPLPRGLRPQHPRRQHLRHR